MLDDFNINIADDHLTNPNNPGNPMLLNLFQREGAGWHLE